MKRTKKIFTMCFALAFCVMSFTMTAFAVTASYNWSFSTTATTMITSKGVKNDKEQSYYITISSGTPSSTNKFGTRIRRSSDAAAMSSYVLHTGLKTGKAYSYNQGITATTGTNYEMRGKKDDGSSSSSALKVVGKVTY